MLSSLIKWTVSKVFISSRKVGITIMVDKIPCKYTEKHLAE